MKSSFLRAIVFAGSIASFSVGVHAQQPMVYETPREFFGTADFNADGRTDIVIVDKETGKYRLGYQAETGLFAWVDCRPSGLKGVTGFNIGRVLAAGAEGLAFASADANQLSLVDVSSPTAPAKPVVIAFQEGLGPNTIAPVEAGGGESKPADLFVASMFNSPEPNLGTLLRNDADQYPKLGEAPLTGTAVRANRLVLKEGGAEYLCMLLTGEKGDTLRIASFAGGKETEVAAVAGLPAGSHYACGSFRAQGSKDFIVYKPGQSRLALYPVEEPAPGKVQFGKETTFELDQPVRRVVALAPQKAFIVLGEGQKAGVYGFEGTKAPTVLQPLAATNDLFTCAAPLKEGLVAFTQPASGKFSTRYQIFKASASGFVSVAFGGLASLADNDNITIPDIHARIVATTKVASQSEMKIYTNTIPGTQVTYVMVPIPGGEFVMGSPEAERDRKPDEGPQHKVRVEPFWMERCEVTWNEYELFMYPDEEKRMRATMATDAAGDKLADAVTHPSKPYVEMSFGMGKDGYPAISMTQHAANKYCQWLSAKTGHFYRLPTEAEWEYACRAGTTTAYFFGDDASALKDYGWYEQNSDFKYQKVGKKKPNPWGLYDMCGNVVEWVLDQYSPDYYQQCAAEPLCIEPWNKATKPYPHSVRGGSWDDEAKMCRSAARRGSDRSWKMQDPQLPKSVWYFSDAQWVGFRIVRPLQVPPPEQMQKYWTSGVERD
jgi:formylglycine-generating enzyme required for sulfatase activity